MQLLVKDRAVEGTKVRKYATWQERVCPSGGRIKAEAEKEEQGGHSCQGITTGGKKVRAVGQRGQDANCARRGVKAAATNARAISQPC